MRKVALVKCHKHYDEDEGGGFIEMLPYFISEYAEVTDRELDILNGYAKRHDGMAIIENITDDIPSIIAEALEAAKIAKAKAEEKGRAREQKRKEAEKKKRERVKAKELEKLKELKKKYEVTRGE